MYHHRIWYFPVINVKRGGEEVFHVSEENGRGGGGGVADAPYHITQILNTRLGSDI